MRNLLICLTAALVAAGCTSSEPDRPLASAKPAVAPIHTPIARALGQATGRSAFASLPDRGRLMTYDTVKAPVRDGATTLYQVQLSETHALNAAAPGRSIAIPTANGETMDFTYASHAEDALGNWTWVGKTREGLNAVITFGEEAVFGQIDLPDSAPLQLITRQGRSFLGVIDTSQVRLGHLLGEGRPDFLIPDSVSFARQITGLGKSESETSPDIAGKSASQASSGIAGKAGQANTVDVLLGYTPGMVTSYGSASAVNTRLTNLVAITNQAYERSLITPRIRLVHTMQVNYTDNNSNEAALSALSGVSCNPSCTSAPVPAELVPLRNAREQFGADLVSLVRPLRAPQQDGCGIAWLAGGNLDTIDNSYAPFGYSMVSDGQDVDETDGNNYLCYVETLAHELGHNMGQAHNTQDASQPGAHSYSYGYRETSTTGFFTIMAYPVPNSSQFPIAHFANPSVNHAGTGRVTGTATADNARSLNITMPLVAQFRATVVPFVGRAARNDFNGDGRSDIVLWNPSLSYLGYWIMNGAVFAGSSGFGVAAGQEPLSTGFLSPISQGSLLTRNTSTRTLHSYIWNGSTHAQATIGQFGDGWVIVGQGDINGDGRDDLLWRFPSNGLFAFWLMDGPVFLGGQTYSPPVFYNIAAVADFNGDGRTDLLWNDTIGRNAGIWLSTGDGFDAHLIGNYGTAWNMVGAADVTGDGKADILLRDTANVFLAYWRMDGVNYLGAAAYGLAADRQLLTTGDFDGDGIQDLVITRNSDRMLWLWRSNGTSFSESNIGQYGTGWTVLR